MVLVEKSSTQLIPFLCYILYFCSVSVGGVTNVRLAGSNIPLEGRVEVYYKGEWGSVCNNGWNPPSKNLEVVCRELGLSKGRDVGTQYPGTGTTWLDGVTCGGNEGSIFACPHKPWGDTSCPHSQDVSVRCDVCQRPVISTDQNLVNDWSFSATSYKESHPPQNARLKSTGSWCLGELRNMAFTHYLEIELPRLYLVSAVATLGGITAANYVKSYRMTYSIDSMEWNTASVDGNQVIQGNGASGNKNVERRDLDNTIRARFLRFVPVTWGSVACMRVEICGHQLPHSPKILVKVKSSSAVVSWSKPDSGGDVIKKYYVRHWKVSEGKNSQKMFESTATSAVIVSHLSPFTHYTLEVSGISDLGEGLPSAYTFRTLEAAPSGSPTRIKSTLLGTTAVNITWAPPDEGKRNGQITGYVICLPQDANREKNCQDQIVVPGSQTWYVVRDLDFSVEHTVQIRAKTAVGTGPIGEGKTGKGPHKHHMKTVTFYPAVTYTLSEIPLVVTRCSGSWVVTRVLGYTSPEGVASSVIIAVSFGGIMIALVIIVILAGKGIILKNFVQALRKLTSSQITIYSQTSKDSNRNKPARNYEDPEATSDDPQTAGDDLYIASGGHTEVIYETFADVRRMTLTLAKESNIYGENKELRQDYAMYHTSEEPLYESRDQIVYDLSKQDVNDQNGAFHRSSLHQPRHEEHENEPRDEDVEPGRVSLPQPDQPESELGDEEIVYDVRDQDMDLQTISFPQPRQQGAEFQENERLNDEQNQDVDPENISFLQPRDQQEFGNNSADVDDLIGQDVDSISVSFPETGQQEQEFGVDIVGISSPEPRHQEKAFENEQLYDLPELEHPYDPLDHDIDSIGISLQAPYNEHELEEDTLSNHDMGDHDVHSVPFSFPQPRDKEFNIEDSGYGSRKKNVGPASISFPKSRVKDTGFPSDDYDSKDSED